MGKNSKNQKHKYVLLLTLFIGIGKDIGPDQETTTILPNQTISMTPTKMIGVENPDLDLNPGKDIGLKSEKDPYQGLNPDQNLGKDISIKREEDPDLGLNQDLNLGKGISIKKEKDQDHAQRRKNIKSIKIVIDLENGHVTAIIIEDSTGDSFLKGSKFEFPAIINFSNK